MMALPFLPASLIRPTYALLRNPSLEIIESNKLEQLHKYFQKRWMTHVDPEELSIHNVDVHTNT